MTLITLDTTLLIIKNTIAGSEHMNIFIFLSFPIELSFSFN